jgi:hypothetical protein
MTWALTTVISARPGDQYTERIAPITEPLFRAYAKRWGMDYCPCFVSPGETAWLVGTIAGNLGTAVVYASIPWRRHLLDRYEGIVYIDLDAVIVNPEQDVRIHVTPERPVAMPKGLTGAVQVLLSCDATKKMLDCCWEERFVWYHQQWAEEGFFKEWFGWDWDYSHGDPAKFLGETDHTDELNEVPWLCGHPFDPEIPDHPWAINPGGIHPFQRRLDIVKEYANALRHP